MAKRKHRDFTLEELKIIRAQSGKINLQTLAGLIEWDYCNLSSALKQQKVAFNPLRTKRVRPAQTDSTMTKKVAEDGKTELLTDDHYKEWFGGSF